MNTQAAIVTELESRVDPATGGRIVTATLLRGRKSFKVAAKGANVRDALLNLEVEVAARGVVTDQPLRHPLDFEVPF